MKNCLLCEEPFYGRSDKKFCNDECRVHYHNQQNRQQNARIRQINRLLRNNYRILRKFLTVNNGIVDEKQLLEEGFTFMFYTHCLEGMNDVSYYFCYDVGYFRNKRNQIRILMDKEKVAS